MNEQNKKVPTIRFKGFTDDWEQRKLGDTVNSIVAGGDIDKSKIQENGKYPVYANALTNDGVIGYYNDQYRVKAPAVTVTGRGEIGVAKTRNTNFTPVVRLLAINSMHNNYFLENLINTHRAFAESTGVPQLTAPQLANYKLKFPKSIEEESKIGNFFNNLDSLITLHQRKLVLLKQLKKGLLQKMFADKDSKRPVLQFKIFHDDWEQRKLGDLIKEFSIKSKIEDEYKVLSSTNSGMKFREGRVTGTSNLGYKIIKNGDLVLSPQNLWLGNININNIGKGLVSPSYKTFKLINIDSSFINPQLRTQKMLEEYKNSSTQGASVVRRNLEIDSFYQIKIFVPTISEQEKIGSFFQRLDNTIVLQHQKLAKCQSVKKSLLQQMFI
ncbi:restriction endonuclease subunit S [Limosilactobacillus reuteri]|uniref:restriction endonuclease subunit S n=1 Tax=Limosilactobacillus reuteri TaxID=1598 RepID=UPI003D01FBF9